MGEEKPAGEEAKLTRREVEVKGRSRERIDQLMARRFALTQQQSKTFLELEKIQGGLDAIMEFCVEPSERVISYNSNTHALIVEEVPAPSEPPKKE